MAESTDTVDAPAKDDDTTTQTLGDGGKRALEAERKARRDAERKATDLEARLAAIEDKDKSEVERLTSQVATLTKDRDAAVVNAARLKVALDRGLTATQAKRLVGSTEEELSADADELLADLGVNRKTEGDTAAVDPPTADTPTDQPDPKQSPASKPRVDLTPGNGVEETPDDVTDVAAIGERMFRR